MTYKPLSSRILPPEVTEAALNALPADERERIERACDRLADYMRQRNVAAGPVLTREILAAVGRLLVEREL